MKTIVISGINIINGGALSVYKDLLSTLVNTGANKKNKFIILVASKKIFKEFKGKFEFIEFPKSKKHWLNRLFYEYIYFRFLSKKIKPDVWLSMHDITPNVTANKQYVYCHNPSPFYHMPIKKAKYGWKYYLFSKFYKYLYKINIHKNTAVIVQQKWMANEFEKMFNLSNVIVAGPSIAGHNIKKDDNSRGKPKFIYPSFPRPFKNFEMVCEATKILNKKGYSNYEVILTLSGFENKYSKYVYKKYNHIANLKFIGIQSREKLFDIYSKTNCLLFTSNLETWGMPLSEYKMFGKYIITVDLPYAKETIGSYRNVSFVHANDPKMLAQAMEKVLKGDFTNISDGKFWDMKQEKENSWQNLCNLIF